MKFYIVEMKQGSVDFSYFARVHLGVNNILLLENVIKANHSTFICAALNPDQRLLEKLCNTVNSAQHGAI